MSGREALVTIFLSSALVIATGGCRQPAPPAGAMPSARPNGGILWMATHPEALPGIDQGTLEIAGGEYAVWYDEAVGSSISNSSNQQGSQSEGYVLKPDRSRITFRSRVAADGSGQVSLDGVEYNLASGRLFLVTTHGGKTRVKQLRRDLSPLTIDREVLAKFAAEDEEMRLFFRRGSETPKR